MAKVFISYGHKDMDPVNWLEKLNLYLAPFRRGDVESWDDMRIRPGSDWKHEIETAMGSASAAILLVGPAFLASDFVTNTELPVILEAAIKRGLKMYPLIIGYCGYSKTPLGKYQAYNKADKPLEALEVAEQNRILNDLSMKVDDDLREIAPMRKLAAMTVKAAVGSISKFLSDTDKAFKSQCGLRDILVSEMTMRLKITEVLEYERFFFRYYSQMNAEEKFQFVKIRAITEGPLYERNKKIFCAIEEYPDVLEEIEGMKDLRQHILFWLNKYEKVFTETPEMCLLYTGVEDGVPFPKGIEENIKRWLEG